MKSGKTGKELNGMFRAGEKSVSVPIVVLIELHVACQREMRNRLIVLPGSRI